MREYNCKTFKVSELVENLKLMAADGWEPIGDEDYYDGKVVVLFTRLNRAEKPILSMDSKEV